jgi:hypothetical protein
MADDDIDYSRYAGKVAFPRNPQDLLSTTHCPACFAVLTSTVCGVCGLDLRHPDAARLHDASVSAAGMLDTRLAIIGRIRYETEEAANLRWAAGQEAARGAAHAPAPAPEVLVPEISASPIREIGVPAVSTLHESQGGPDPTGVNVDSIRDTRVPNRNAAVPTSPQPRRSSVQVTLLIVGVSLLSVAAIFFLVYAFINFGIVWRSVIIGAITVAAFVVASLLRRRSLTATAEGIAVFAVVLVYLDAWAIRANDFFGASRADGTLYWGITLIAAAIGFLCWYRVSALRVPNFVGFATFAPGVGVLVGGLTKNLEAGTSAFLVFASVAAAGIVHRWVARPEKPAFVERVIVLCTTTIALVVSLLLCLGVSRDLDWAPAVAAIAVAAIAAAHVWALHAGRTPASVIGFFTRVFAGVGGVAAAAAIGLWASRTEIEPFLFIAPPLAAVAVALGLDMMADRLTPGLLRTATVVAGWSAAAVAAIALATPLFFGVMASIFATVRTAIPVWSIDPTDAVGAFAQDTLCAVVALAAVTILASGAWTVTRRLGSPARSIALLWAAATTIVIAIPELRMQWLVFSGWLLIAVACLAALLLTRGMAGVRPPHRAVLVTTMVVAGTLGYLVGWATTTTWWIGTLVVIGILIALRPLVASAGGKAALLGSGLGIALLSVGSVADQLNLHTDTALGVSLTDRVVLTALVSVVALAGSAIPIGITSATDRRVAFWVAGAASAISVPFASVLVTNLPEASRRTLLLPEFGTSLAIALVLLIALALWVGLRGNTALRAERIVASIAATPALYLVLSAFVRLLGLSGFIATVVPITAALLAAAGSLAVTLLRPTSMPRWSRELGVALVAVPAVVTAVRSDGGSGWLVLTLAAVAVLLLAIDREGLFSSRSARHHLGWLALALATAGFWWRLSGDRVDDLAAYVVPLSLVLIVIAGLIGEAARREQPSRISKAAPLIALGGFLASLLPLGINAATGTLSEAIWIVAVSSVLLLVGSTITGGPRWQWNADAAALAGAIGVVVVAVGRAIFLPGADLERDAWLAGLFLVLMIAAFLQARARATGSERIRAIASQTLGIIAMTAVLVLEIPAFRDGVAGDIRALALVLLFSALHVIAFLVSRAPLTRLVALVSISYAVVAGMAATALDTLDAVEFASLPIALALLVTGFTQLRGVPTARSWAWLAPGTTVLLVPSLLATIEDRPLWRLVGLGVVGIAVIVIAVAQRLQAPFVIGVVVVLVHGIATFLPQLRAAYEFLPWWLWLGAGGILLIVLAARYEQRIRNLRSVAMKFAALR